MTDDVMTALGQVAQELSDAFARLADILHSGADPFATPSGSSFAPMSSRTPMRERLLRQALIIDEVVAAGGNKRSGISKATWGEIAAKYGYSGRGTAGFFNNGGLMEMREVEGVTKVYVTKAGNDRLKAHRDQVAAFRAQQEQQLVSA